MEKKIISVFFIIFCFAFLTAGCGKKEQTSIATTKAEEEVLDVSIKLINKIEKEDYKNLKDLIYLPEQSFVTNEDIVWFLPRTNLADLIGKRTDVSALEFGEGNVPTNVTESETVAKTITYQSLENENKSYELLYVLNSENKWKLYLENFLVDEFNFVADKNLNINVNGKDIDASYITNNYTGSDAPSKNSVVYTIPNVPNKEIPIKITQGKNTKTVRVNAGSKRTVIIQ